MKFNIFPKDTEFQSRQGKMLMSFLGKSGPVNVISYCYTTSSRYFAEKLIKIFNIVDNNTSQ